MAENIRGLGRDGTLILGNLERLGSQGLVRNSLESCCAQLLPGATTRSSEDLQDVDATT